MLLTCDTFTGNRDNFNLCDLMICRLKVIREENIKVPTEVVIRLNSLGLVSKYYDERSANIDIWYLYDRRQRNWKQNSSITDAVDNPYCALLMAVVIDAIQDVHYGRPCDLGVWRIDYPPGNKKIKCIPSDHICADEALMYIKELDSRIEEVLNLSPGFLRSLVNGKW